MDQWKTNIITKIIIKKIILNIKKINFRNFLILIITVIAIIPLENKTLYPNIINLNFLLIMNSKINYQLI